MKFQLVPENGEGSDEAAINIRIVKVSYRETGPSCTPSTKQMLTTSKKFRIRRKILWTAFQHKSHRIDEFGRHLVAIVPAVRMSRNSAGLNAK